MALLEAKNLLKTWSGRKVLEAPELCFERARITAVCGPNGAGKTTLLKILALLDHPDQGTVSYQGKILSSHGDWYAARKTITMVDQNPYAFHGSVFHNVAYGLKIRGTGRAEQAARVGSALSEVGLSCFEQRRARTLSGGEVQRMCIARALVCDPSVLILDEPTAHVDAERVREVEDLVRGLRESRGVAIILATHSSSQACRLADRVLAIEGGSIREEGGAMAEGRLVRSKGGLAIELPDQAPGILQARIVSLELSGATVIIRLDAMPGLIRVPEKDVREHKPLPGQTVEIITTRTA